MIKKICILLIFVSCLFFVSCKKNKSCSAKQSLSLNICSEPQSLDPRNVRDLNAVNLSKFFFEGLMRISKDGSLQCAIAKSYFLSEDGKTYTFKLKDTFWSNNDKLTSYDFAYTWRKILSPSFITSNASSLFIFKNAKQAKEGFLDVDDVGIHTPDEKTLIVELEKPSPYFLKLLSCPAFFAVNRKVDQKNPKWAQEAKSFVSNGAFLLSKWKHQDSLVLTKNPLYWDATEVKLDKITMMMLTPDVELDMFEMEQIDIAGSPFSTILVDSLQKVKKDKDFHILPYYGTSFLRVNTQKIKDKNFRQALVRAFDRKKITEHILQGGQIQTTRLVPTDEKLDIPIFENDFNNRKVILTYVSGDRSHLLAQALQRDLEKNLNIQVQLQALERKTYYDRLASSDYEIAMSSWIADFDDPIDFLNVFKYKDSSTNNTGWENKEYISLLEKSEKILDADAREQILLEAENILLDDAPIVPICHLTQNFLQKDNLKDVFIYPSGFIDLKYAYFE